MWNCFAVCKCHANDGGSPCWAYIQCVLPGVIFNSSQVPSCFLIARKNFRRAVWNPLWRVELRNLFHGGMLLFVVIDMSVQIHPIGKNGGLERITQTPTQCVRTWPDSEFLMLISHVTFESSLHYSRALLLTRHMCKTYLKCLLKTVCQPHPRPVQPKSPRMHGWELFPGWELCLGWSPVLCTRTP